MEDRHAQISQVIAYVHHYWSQYPKMRLGQIVEAAAHQAGVETYDLGDRELVNMIEQIWVEQVSNGAD